MLAPQGDPAATVAVVVRAGLGGPPLAAVFDRTGLGRCDPSDPRQVTRNRRRPSDTIPECSLSPLIEQVICQPTSRPPVSTDPGKAAVSVARRRTPHCGSTEVPILAGPDSTRSGSAINRLA